LKIVHYYRDALRPSGVSVAIASLQRAAQMVGVEAHVAYAGTYGSWATNGQMIAHIGRGRQLQFPWGTRWLDGVDLLVLHEGWTTSNHIAARLAAGRRIPYVVVAHGVYEPGVMEGLRGRRLRVRAERKYLENAHAVHVFFSGEGQLVRSIAPKSKTHVLRLGFEPTNTVAKADRHGYLAWFGRYDPYHKGLDRMLFAYALTPPRQRRRLMMRGVDYNNGKARVLELVATLELEDFVEVGPVLLDKDKSEFLAGASAFLFPSRWEGFGIALVEALAFGLPALISRDIQFAEILGERNAASVVDFGDLVEVAKAIEMLPGQTVMGAAARRFVYEELAPTRMAALYLKFLRGLSSHER
jgi:glycosyltransferase involved in cell wall biosynthesis